MTNPRAFISFDFDHNEREKRLFVGQIKNSRTPFSIEDWSSKKTLPQNQWEKLIKDKVSRCHMVIVLVGKNMASARGVDKEIKMAQELNVPVFGVYVGGAKSSSKLPVGLPRNKTINWNWNAIAISVDKAMKEGKNAKNDSEDFLIGLVAIIGILLLAIIISNKKKLVLSSYWRLQTIMALEI